ncbi:helicase domain-containing protein [Paenibacillus algicola]|uniref:DNA 3'-5' helicase n=1 Tax=Paenibacillus algicola TaxID=2565926 RepID=A0A4P8XRD2_9BACL|nr:DEAD/DEAH box helicase [Paenibacillus algicola]QCT04361.1 helicase domain-containing protein [Paenibacillus algicola]
MNNYKRIEQDLLRMMQDSNQKVLFVFKGFPASFFETMPLRKLIPYSVTISIHELDQAKASILPEMFQSLHQINQAAWCTYEEYQVIGTEVLSLYFNIMIYENNVYHRTFPCLYSIPAAERLFITYFEDENSTEEPEQDPDFEIFQKYYGTLKKIDNNWFIVYADSEPAIDYYSIPDLDLPERKLANDDTAELELVEEEDVLVGLIARVLSNTATEQQEVRISYTGDLSVSIHRYRARIQLLQSLLPHITFVLTTKTTSLVPQLYETEYLRVLEKYWNYTSFRDLRMYKDIHDPEFKKETVFIPQSQVIDSIVQQATLAHQGESYRDIFVTSPTGAGKSVMFQVPAIYLAEKYGLMTIVISPLIGLMTDQVQGLMDRNVHMSATINSEITPVEKMGIIERIRTREISILYISPETLLSRSDIAQLIGDREIGLFVIDEAHIVTTWGKAFRSDYWYLGSYLQRLRKKEMQFPIATFTATAIYGGVEDMYAETRDSLNLINPISYFGYVKRDDLEVRIKKSSQSKERFKEYLEDKFKVLVFRLEQYLAKDEKTLVYFPTVGLINQFHEFSKIFASERLRQHLTSYYGPLSKDLKNGNYKRFKEGESLVMLATKAFGMGIDLPDIVNVYHFAPTGNVCDYVQEIGRAARALERGYAYFDFLPKDFVHVNRLHGISTIRKQQLVQVMAKVVQLINENKHSSNVRHLLVNAEEFRYIFQQGAEASDEVDNKLKTALLIIEKDFKAKMGYSPIIARPRSVFAKEYFMIQKDQEQQILERYGRYFKKVAEGHKTVYGNIYTCDMKNLWESRFQSLSFPQFKYKFHSKDEDLGLPFLVNLLPVLQLQLVLKSVHRDQFTNELNHQLELIADIFGAYAKERSYFSISEFAAELKKKIKGDKYFCENLASILIHSADHYDRIMQKHSNFYQRFMKYSESKEKYSIQNSGYAGFLDWIKIEWRQILNQGQQINTEPSHVTMFLPKVSPEKVEKTFILLGILEALGNLIYRVNGGDNPEIFLRINSRMQIERSIQNPARYINYILENVKERHYLSVAMLTHLFENEVDNDRFWEYIENYFLGIIPDEVLAKTGNSRS